MKLHILKVTDRDDSSSFTDVQYFSIKSLREQVLNEWYDIWGERTDDPQDYSKEQIKESDEDLFSYMDSWGFDVEVIFIVTEKDLN